MSPQQLTQYIGSLAGVEACFVAQADGTILSSQMPAIFDEQAMSEMTIGAVNIFETFRSELDDCKEILLDMELRKLLIRELDQAFLFSIIDDAAQESNVRIAGNVAAKRFQFALQNTSVSLNPSHSASPSTVNITKSIFGLPKRKEDKPAKDKDSGSIWG